MAEEEKNERMLSPQMIKTFGAMAGGVVEACSLQPLDVLKTRMQISGQGLLPTLTRTLKNEGVLALYKGLSPFCTHLVLKYSVRWWFNDTYRSLLADKDGKVSTPASFLAGLMSGVTEAVLIVTPFEVVKTRLQTQVSFGTKLKYNGPVDVVRKVIKEEGVQSLWKGNGPTMVRQGWNQLLLFGPYGIIKEAVFDKKFHEPLETHQTILLGTLVGSLGPLTNNPFDVAKTRLMNQREVGKARKYTNMFQCILDVLKKEGILALWRGCFMRISRVAPGMGITFTVVETFQKWFN